MKNPIAILTIALLAATLAVQTNAGSSLELLGTQANKEQGLPFSEAVAFADLLFLSGQIGLKPGASKLVEGGITAETTQTMLNIRNTLEKYGSSMDKIIKCTIFLGNMDDWAEMNIAYLHALGDHRPARSALGASGLALNGSVEIECIAAR